MARKVYFSFHYDRDIRRVVQIRNSWVVRAEKETQPFLDKAEWESIMRSGRQTIEKWIENQIDGTSVTVVLIGSETYDREWVRHEIKRSYELTKGILGIYIHNVKDPQYGTDTKGQKPTGLLDCRAERKESTIFELVQDLRLGKRRRLHESCCVG